MTRIFSALSGLALAALLGAATPALAQNGPPQAGFQITNRDPNMVEIHFRNMPLRAVHADASQNALALDFNGGVDGSAFDRLAAVMPDWISMAYANFDNGVIRASRPVTFLTRNESDGFSLRMMANAPGPMVAAPPGPVALRGPVDGGQMGPPPQQQAAQPQPTTNLFARYNAYGALRGYDQLELAVNPNSSYWQNAYARAAVQSNSEVALGGEYHSYHSGDQVIASHARVKITLADGISIIGSVYDTDASATKERLPTGAFASNTQTNLISGALGIGLELTPDSEMTLQALQGNHVSGVKFTGYDGDPSTFWQVVAAWHQPYMDTPEAIAARAFTDHVELGGTAQMGWGFSGSLAAHGDNYGVHGDASVAKIAGWAASLRWSDALGPILASLAYDGHGDYLVNNDTRAGAAPSPYVPLSLRNMETHAVTGSLSSLLWGDSLWMDMYGGYIVDRYTTDGAIYGAALRWRPAPGLDIALGARRTNVSTTQGELGGETSAGLTFTLGFAGPSLGYF